MLRRAASWREKQKTAEYHAALLKTRSMILKAISIDYEDVSCERQSNEFMDQTGAVSGSVSLHLGGQLEDIYVTGAASQDYCENNVTACSVGTEQSDNTIGQCSESLDLVWEEETCSVVQTCTPQDGSENGAVVLPLPELDQQLSLGAAAVAASTNQWLQLDIGVCMSRSMSEGNNDSDPSANFSPCVPLTSPVPTEHKEVENTRVSSDADEEVILKVADQLSLADEVCEVEGDAEQYTEVRMCNGMGKAGRVLSHTAKVIYKSIQLTSTLKWRQHVLQRYQHHCPQPHGVTTQECNVEQMLISPSLTVHDVLLDG
jgi:hypothetical protein